MEAPIDEENLRRTTLEAEADIAKILRAIAHKKRLEILALLIDRKQTFVDLLRSTEISRTALANHLSQLTAHGLVERLERGQYQITVDGQEMLHTVVQSYLGSQIRVSNERRRLMERYTKKGKGVSRMKKLENLKFVPHEVSHLGCLDGCLQYLGMDVSTPWLYGATGHAFVINIAAKDVCPSGPTAWRTRMLFDLAPNIGYKIDGFWSQKEAQDFDKKKKETWDFVRREIDANHPCYGWQIGDIADFYIIYGYDDIGYYYKGYHQEEGAGPKPWNEIGEMFLEVNSVKRVEPSDEITTMKQALEKILEHSKGKYIASPTYKAGIEGFDVWINALESGSAAMFGNAYNAVVWAECRKYGIDFLQEAEERLKGRAKSLFEEAKGHYEIVAQKLARVSELYPFSPELKMDPIKTDAKSREAVETLKVARDAEAAGLKALEKILNAL
jgi:DNA-binding transcriptional ArsR family regulator